MDGRRVRVEFTRDSRWGDRDSGSRYGRGKVGNLLTEYNAHLEIPAKLELMQQTKEPLFVAASRPKNWVQAGC